MKKCSKQAYFYYTLTNIRLTSFFAVLQSQRCNRLGL
nr:MAG TPA: hypothetical protein [Caudoviricetes sp.]